MIPVPPTPKLSRMGDRVWDEVVSGPVQVLELSEVALDSVGNGDENGKECRTGFVRKWSFVVSLSASVSVSDVQLEWDGESKSEPEPKSESESESEFESESSKKDFVLEMVVEMEVRAEI